MASSVTAGVPALCLHRTLALGSMIVLAADHEVDSRDDR
jgi:hypothetical protein